MCDKEFKELVKIAVEKLKDESVLKLLQTDASYQKDKDYRIVDEPPPVGKDFNDFLMSYLGIAMRAALSDRQLGCDSRGVSSLLTVW